MKNFIFFTVGFITAFILHISSTCTSKAELSIGYKMKELRFILKDSIGDVLSNEDFRQSISDIPYAEGADPYGVYNQENGIISNATVAYNIACAILSDKYGKEFVYENEPFIIALYNNKYWLIEGSTYHTEKNKKRGGVYMVLRKDDGQIQMLRVEK